MLRPSLRRAPDAYPAGLARTLVVVAGQVLILPVFGLSVAVTQYLPVGPVAAPAVWGRAIALRRDVEVPVA